MKNPLLWRVMRKNISAGQIAGYAFANFVGLTIILTALQFYCDTRSFFSPTEKESTKEYMVLSKRVSALGSLIASNDGISPDDIKQLESQSWTSGVAPFKSSLFDVTASVDFGGRGFSTALFFESVPDEFLDIHPQGWSFTPGDEEVPIILSKDYLNIYNFGFAPSRGLPVLTEKMIGMAPLKISVSGNGKQTTLRGRIVGFSSRLNTIAVPEGFMDWANANFANAPETNPSRLIVAVSDPGNPQIESYLSASSLEPSNESGISGKINFMLKILCGIILSIGALISLLAIFILILSVYLLVQKNRDKIRDLFLLGFTVKQLCSGYMRLTLTVNASVTLMAVATVVISRGLWVKALSSVAIVQTSVAPAIFIAMLILILISLLSYFIITSKVKRCIN